MGMNAIVVVRRKYMIDDFTKLECPFIRKHYDIDVADFKKYGSALQLRDPQVYLVTPEIAEGFSWVIDDKYTTAIEKLDGSNVGLVVENNRIVHIQNRKNSIDMYQINGGRAHYVEGIMYAIGKDYVENGIRYGEVLGPKLQSNPYKLPMHLWYPFKLAQKHLLYKSFHNHERGFWQFSDWFRSFLKSIFYSRYHKIPLSDMFTNPEVPFAEGIVFYNQEISQIPDKPRMAKLRRNMFPWYYWDKIKIIGLEDSWLEYAEKNNLYVKGYRENEAILYG